MKSAFIKITLIMAYIHRFLPHYSFLEILNFVAYHAVINLPHLIIGHNHQKLTDCNQGPVFRTLRAVAFDLVCQRPRFRDIS